MYYFRIKILILGFKKFDVFSDGNPDSQLNMQNAAGKYVLYSTKGLPDPNWNVL